MTQGGARSMVNGIWDFVILLRSNSLVGSQVVFSVRDALAYADYITNFLKAGLKQPKAFEQSCRAVHLDSLGCSGYDLENSQGEIGNFA